MHMSLASSCSILRNDLMPILLPCYVCQFVSACWHSFSILSCSRWLMNSSLNSTSAAWCHSASVIPTVSQWSGPRCLPYFIQSVTRNVWQRRQWWEILFCALKHLCFCCGTTAQFVPWPPQLCLSIASCCLVLWSSSFWTQDLYVSAVSIRGCSEITESVGHLVWFHTANIVFCMGIGSWAPCPSSQPGGPGYFVWQLTWYPSSIAACTSSCPATSTAFTLSDAHKPPFFSIWICHHQGEVTITGGFSFI
jgi:hypothetical protein